MNRQNLIFVPNSILGVIFAGFTAVMGANAQVDIRSFGARCDGRDDAAAVQAAINSIPASGGTLVVPCQATIGSSGIVLTGKSNVTIYGTGGNAGFRSSAPTGLSSMGFSPVVFLVQSCTNCVVRDLFLEGNLVGAAAIGFDRCTDTTAQNLTVSNVAYPAQAAIVATGNVRNRYIGNTVTNTTGISSDGARGMWIGNGGNNNEYSPTISGNTVRNIGATGIVLHTTSATASGNLVEEAEGAGIKIVPLHGGGGQSTLSDNTLRRNLFHGIQVETADSPIIIQNNTIDANAISGIYSSGGAFANGRITGNTISNHREAGIYLYDATGVAIQNNRLSGNGHGILFESARAGAINNVQISGNTLSAQNGDGVAMWSRGGTIGAVAVSSNSISNTGGYGMFIEEQGAGTISGITASANCFAGCGRGTLYDNRSGGLTPPAASSTCSTPGTADTTPPTVSLTSPAGGAVVSGTVTLSANASDAGGIGGVQFQLNGSNLGTEVTASTYTYLWDTRSVANGTYALTAVARDKAGNRTTSAAVYVTVTNADTTKPSIQITSPAGGATVSGTVTLSASASDNVGVAGVRYTLDGASLGNELTASPFGLSWNTTTASNGSHQLTATARDAAGNQNSATVTVTVSNVVADKTAPTVSISAPLAHGTVSGSVVITASASDNIGVSGVQFLIDGAPYGSEDTASPYTVTWNSTSAPNGTHTISAVARDAAGNRTTSAAIAVNVSNATSTPLGFTPIRVNAGGGAWKDPGGNVWAADNGTTGGYVYATSKAIAGTTTPAIYQTVHWNMGPMTYRFTVPNGSYLVNLKFAEVYWSGAGQRVMNVSINGSQVLRGFDPVAAAGSAFRAVDRAIPVSVTGGQISIVLTATVDAPAINAIEILEATATPAAKTAIRLNAGSSAYTDPSGNLWSADFGSTDGWPWSTDAVIGNTNTPELYRTLRWNAGPLTYRFTAPNGTYSVKLRFAEVYWSGAGQRVMNATINGQQVLSNFDIVQQAGGMNRPVDAQFSVNVTNGEIVIVLTASVDNPQVNAIEIWN